MDRFGLIEQKLINEFQHHFPCVKRPYQEIGERLGITESAVLTNLERLKAAGIISRIGPVFSPGKIGCSTLAALAVPPEALASTAEWISALPETNHNYQREDAFNVWFVITASNQAHLADTIAGIKNTCDFPLLTLPLLEQFHIDLGFDLASPQDEVKRNHHTSINHGDCDPVQMTAAQLEVVRKLQSGIPLVAEPYGALWPDDENQVGFALNQINAWKQSGVIKRFGVVVRHYELGYRENAMVVWNVPDAQVKEIGNHAAQIPAVTLCYRRPRQLPEWPYNLFCMIHGKCRTIVEEHIAAICNETGLGAYPMKILFSTRRFKQQGARYVA